jgi:hypothetical protein
VVKGETNVNVLRPNWIAIGHLVLFY